MPTDDQSFAAATRLLATPDLLEKILINLSTCNVFGVLRTSKGFHSTIDGSVKSQRAMFLRHDPSIVYDADSLLINPLLNELFFVWSKDFARDMNKGFQFLRQDAGEYWYGHPDGSEGKSDDEKPRSQELSLIFEYKKKCDHAMRPVKTHKLLRFKNRRRKRSVWSSLRRRTIVAQGAPWDGLKTAVDTYIIDRSEKPRSAYLGYGGKTWTDMTLRDAIDNLEFLIRNEIEEDCSF